MGEVYRAHDTTLHRDVAVKVLPDLIAQQPERVTRFTREAQLLAALNHPNIAIKRDTLWFYMSVRQQGQRQNTLNVYYNGNTGNPNAWTYEPDYTRPAFSDRTWENYTPRITWQASRRNKFSFSWDEQPVCRRCTGTASFSGSPAPAAMPPPPQPR